MRNLLFAVILIFSLNCFAQGDDCDTPCGYCNCEEVEGEASAGTSLYTILATGAACLIAFFVLKRK